MTAAMEAAKAGYPVHLVAEEGQLGGVWGDIYKRVDVPKQVRGQVR